MFWAVAQCQTQREDIAALFLGQRGFETYLPKIKERRRETPLFPGYLFVQIHTFWYPILSTVGVLRLLRIGDIPCRVPDNVVTKIQKQTDPKSGLVRLPKPRGLELGDQVRIVRGSFLGHVGVFDGMHGKDRSRILLELLGRKVSIDCDRADFCPIPVAS